MAPLTTTALALTLILAQRPDADSLDRAIQREMQRRNIPGLSIAVMDSGKIVLARGYGVTVRGGNAPVTAATRFQAGSISKPVTAVGVMRLVERGQLQLDRDVNEYLRSWKVPDTVVAAGEKVTVRGLLSHSAGVGVHGFDGYASTVVPPTLLQVLDGVKPANSPAIRIEQRPGARHRYSGGGYTILQQLLIDVTRQPFDEYMMREVLAPVDMTASTFTQPLPPSLVPDAATGHLPDGTSVPGGWHVYPEMAAAGLWTTPTDLAKFALGLYQSVRREPAALLQPEGARQMLSYQRNDFMGLGVFLRGNNDRLEFSHNGRDEGFDAAMTATTSGQGVVIMMNANDDSDIMGRIQRIVARMYEWPNYRQPPSTPHAVTGVAAMDDLNGHYEVRSSEPATFKARDGRLYSYVGGRLDEEFVPVGPDRFTRADGGETFQFRRDGSGHVVGASVTDPDGTREAPRLGPLDLDAAFPDARDPDRPRTRRLTALLRALADGSAGAQALTPGALRDHGASPAQDLSGIERVTYAGEEDVSGRGITRHGGDVARIVYLRARVGGRVHYVLMFLTKDGLLTELDHFPW